MAEKILIVDDDVDTLKLVGLMLHKQGYQIIAAPSGSQGLKKALDERPALVLLDVMMPEMDGYEVARRLRKNPATASIPILMFTAKTQLDDKVTGFEMGADDYLTKPTNPAELQAHVKALLTRKGLNGNGHKGNNGHVAPAGNDRVPATVSEQNGYVIGVLAARSGLGVSSTASNVAASLVAKSRSDVILAELTPGKGSLGMDLGVPDQNALTDILRDSVAEVTIEKVRDSLLYHSSGIKLFLASENPRDVKLTSRIQNYQALMTRLQRLARFVVLDLGDGLPDFVEKILPICNECIVVMEGALNSVQRTKNLIDELVSLKINRKNISVILNNPQRPNGLLSLNQAQEKLGHLISAILTPAPELFLQAARMHSPVVFTDPSNYISLQFLKIADSIMEHQKAR
ncbi:MAG: response regulator [bacterium]|nr:response regulator [bacterium]